MKKIILAATVLSITIPTMAQKSKNLKETQKTETTNVAPVRLNDAGVAVEAAVEVESKYKTTMSGLIMKMNGAQTSEAFEAASNGFERVAAAEPNEWLPKYYVAYSQIMSVFMSKEKGESDARLDAADKMIEAIGLVENNSELHTLKAMCYQARIGVNPMERGEKYGLLAFESLNIARELDPTNPRPDFLQGQSAFYTPEAFGGGKKLAKQLFESSVEKFKKFTPANNLMPNWGMEAAKSMLVQCSK